MSAENRVRGRALGSEHRVDRETELPRGLSSGNRVELRAERVGPTSYGKEQDQLTSLSYYGARYFDPLSLTWTQADPLYRFAPDAAWDEPRRANLYAFSLQNPLRYVDPDGRCPGLVECAAVFGAAVGEGAVTAALLPVAVVGAGVTWSAVANKSASEAGYTCNMAGHCMPALHFESAPKPLQTSVEDPSNPDVPSESQASQGSAPKEDPLAGGGSKPLGGKPGAGAPGTAGGPRAGKDFTPSGKGQIDAENASRHGGSNKCDKCGGDVVPGKKNERGVAPPANQRERDHVIPKSKGGDGSPPNGRVLCRTCNAKKSDKIE